MPPEAPPTIPPATSPGKESGRREGILTAAQKAKASKGRTPRKAARKAAPKKAAERQATTAKLGPFPQGIIRITGRTAEQVERNYAAVVAVVKDGREPGEVAKQQGRSASQINRVVKIAKGELQPERIGINGKGELVTAN